MVASLSAGIGFDCVKGSIGTVGSVVIITKTVA